MSSAASKLTPVVDPTVYPVTDDMGDPTLQTLISVMLLSLLNRWLVSRGESIFVGMNQFFYWKQYDASECVAPDVYVLPGAPLSHRVGAWKVWETGFVPSLAFELVSSDVEKDYRTVPPKYARLGVDELVVFDPDHAQDPSRSRFQVYRKSKRGWSCVLHTNADRVRSQVLGCHLRVVGEGGAQPGHVVDGHPEHGDAHAHAADGDHRPDRARQGPAQHRAPRRSLVREFLGRRGRDAPERAPR